MVDYEWHHKFCFLLVFYQCFMSNLVKFLNRNALFFIKFLQKISLLIMKLLKHLFKTGIFIFQLQRWKEKASYLATITVSNMYNAQHHTHPPGLAKTKTKTQHRIIVHNSNHFRLQVFQVFIRIYHTPLGNGITAYLNLHLYSRLHCCITIGTLHNHRAICVAIKHGY